MSELRFGWAAGFGGFSFGHMGCSYVSRNEET